jgi:hypothetical protein
MGLMLKHLARRRVAPFVLGVDWQVDSVRIALFDRANQPSQPHPQQLLGCWHLSLPLLSLNGPVQAPAEWQQFIAQVAGKLGSTPLHINVGIPNKLCTWLHCPAGLFEGRTNPITLQLHYQRMAAAALNIEPVNLRVCHLQLSSNFSFLVVTKRHYDDQIGQLISSVHDAIEGSVVGCIEPQGFTKVFAPNFLNNSGGLGDAYSMAWFMANKVRGPLC